jgi:glycosyltransferase involved in cell wall biosynthesis
LDPIRLDIIVPCYNPPQDWGRRLLESVTAIEAEIGREAEITLILVNDGSRSGVSEEDLTLLRDHLPRFRYMAYRPNHGKGHALRSGVAIARGQFQMYTDIDFPYTLGSFVAVFRTLVSGQADVVAGIRDADYYRHVPAVRKFISKALRGLLHAFLRTKITDTQGGLKGFNHKGREIFLQTKIKRFLFDLEFIHLASNSTSASITPVKIHLNPEVVFSKARLGILLRESYNFASIFVRGLRARLSKLLRPGGR